jgi:hypothetical protein
MARRFVICWPRAARRGLARLLLALALATGLATGPLGAVTHAFEHVDHAAGEQQKHPGHAGAACDLCGAYAAFANSGSGGTAPLALDTPVAFVPGHQPTPVGARTFAPYFQRGPPSLPCSA